MGVVDGGSLDELDVELEEVLLLLAAGSVSTGGELLEDGVDDCDPGAGPAAWVRALVRAAVVRLGVPLVASGVVAVELALGRAPMEMLGVGQAVTCALVAGGRDGPVAVSAPFGSMLRTPRTAAKLMVRTNSTPNAATA